MAQINTRLKRIEFTNFKALKSYSLTLTGMNVLTGPNNSGKSTIIGALRTLDAALRHARVRAPTRVYASEEGHVGYRIPEDSVPISLENVQTDYNGEEARIQFFFGNGNSLILVFHYALQMFKRLAPTRNSHKPRSLQDLMPKIYAGLVVADASPGKLGLLPVEAGIAVARHWDAFLATYGHDAKTYGVWAASGKRRKAQQRENSAFLGVEGEIKEFFGSGKLTRDQVAAPTDEDATERRKRLG